MNDTNFVPPGGEEVQDDDLVAVYGEQEAEPDDVAELAGNRDDFKPWHHPVKQIVRSRQWAKLTKKLIDDRPQGAPQVLRYFTLPGADLLDVRVLADICQPKDVKIEYFGFDAGNAQSGNDASPNDSIAHVGGTSTTAESALRQAGRITSDAVILPDRLEDIALPESQAAIQLSHRTTFDVINIDACDHLAYCPKGRTHNTFDALRALLRHQMRATTPWLLFVTTRVEPGLLGQPGIVFQDAITQNLRIRDSKFGPALADCLEADGGKLAAELANIWSTHDARFLRLYSVGLGKFLLQFFHAQPNLPANVELASAYAYRVHGANPDMLALAFRITPDALRIFEPNVGGAAVIPALEPIRASYVATQARKLQDLDEALESKEDIRNEAVSGTKKLLQSANYSIAAWCNWISNHEYRPMKVEYT